MRNIVAGSTSSGEAWFTSHHSKTAINRTIRVADAETGLGRDNTARMRCEVTIAKDAGIERNDQRSPKTNTNFMLCPTLSGE